MFSERGEMLCATRRFRQPRREGTAHMLCPPAETPSGREASSHERMTLGGLIASAAGRSALASRLDKKCVAPYEAEELEALDLARCRLIWTWDNGDIHPTALLCLPMQDLDGGLPETLPCAFPLPGASWIVTGMAGCTCMPGMCWWCATKPDSTAW